jgi:hypothetical protein
MPKLDAPKPHRFIAHDDAPFSQQTFYISVAKAKSTLEPNATRDDFLRVSVARITGMMMRFVMR